MRQRPPAREDVPLGKRAEADPIPPPTIGYLRRQGVNGFRVSCLSEVCRRSTVVSFDAAGLSEDLPFPQIERGGQLVCSVCGSKRATVMPDWPPAQGSGRGHVCSEERS